MDSNHWLLAYEASALTTAPYKKYPGYEYPLISIVQKRFNFIYDCRANVKLKWFDSPFHRRKGVMPRIPRYALFVTYYLAWITAHYVAAHTYARYCTASSVWGFVSSPFITSTPHCEGLRWMISTGGSNIATMWTLFGVWITTWITTHLTNL